MYFVTAMFFIFIMVDEYTSLSLCKIDFVSRFGPVGLVATAAVEQSLKQQIGAGCRVVGDMEFSNKT